MDVAELSAREEIRDVVARYAQFADRGRFAELASLFTEDGILEIEGREAVAGRSAIERFLGSVKDELWHGSRPARIRHHVSSLSIDVTAPTEASAASYFLVLTDRGIDHWGSYRDTLLRVAGRWRFARRKVRVEGRSREPTFP